MDNESTPLLRILDAAANRAGEGIRVVEDYVRFVLDDRFLTSEVKQLRHDLTAALARLPAAERHAARETLADVGTSVTTESEGKRGDAEAVVAASLKRVEEALRSLEEYGKVGDAEFAAAIERLRYRVYTLERAIDITRTSLRRLADARLYVLVDGRSNADEFERLVRSLIEAGVDIVQLREKRLSDRELIGRARRLRALTRATKTLFVVNDRPDIARLADADGVHVGQDEFSVKDARTIVGPRALIGVSTHSIEQARQAVLDGANYIGIGPTFVSPTKEFETYPGLELLRAVAGEIRLPAFAIGGITLANVEEVLSTGIRRVAVSSAVCEAADAASAAKKLRQNLDQRR
jgi:thiamine-phosphate pyrophosphorylase